MFTIGTSSEVIKSYELKEAIDLLARNGYRAIEIWMNRFSKKSINLKSIKKQLHDSGLKYRIHVDARDINLTSNNQGIREESFFQTLNAIRLASQLEAPVVTFHPGKMSSTKDIISEFQDMQIDTIGNLTSHAEKYGVILGMENMEKRPKEIFMDLSEIKLLFDKIKSPNLGLTLDLAHYHSVGNLLDFVNQLDTPVVNVHISQASPSKMHLPLTSSDDGIINFSEILSALHQKYHGPLIIEGYVQGKEEETIRTNINWLQHCLCDLRLVSI